MQENLNILDIQNVSKSFKGKKAIFDLSLSAKQGELIGLIGPDGAGKTTLMRMCLKNLNMDKGTILLFGKSLEDLSWKNKVGYLPQKACLYGDLSILENLRFFGKIFGLSRHEFEKRFETSMEWTLLKPFIHRQAKQLSGGMYKKLGVACAILHQPQILFLDEPTNGVDPVSRKELWENLKHFARQGMTLIVSTSYMDEAHMCDKVWLLHQGSLLAQGKPQELLENMNGGVFYIPQEITLEESFLSLCSDQMTFGNEIRIFTLKKEETLSYFKKKEIPYREGKLSFEDLFMMKVKGEET